MKPVFQAYSELKNRKLTLVMPIFFRLLFECGLRCSEARLLILSDIDLETGCLTIRKSKNHNDFVMVSASMLVRLREYSAVVHSLSDDNTFFFPGARQSDVTDKR
jgi:integrase